VSGPSAGKRAYRSPEVQGAGPHLVTSGPISTQPGRPARQSFGQGRQLQRQLPSPQRAQRAQRTAQTRTYLASSIGYIGKNGCKCLAVGGARPRSFQKHSVTSPWPSAGSVVIKWFNHGRPPRATDCTIDPQRTEAVGLSIGVRTFIETATAPGKPVVARPRPLSKNQLQLMSPHPLDEPHRRHRCAYSVSSVPLW
jgi:hypothetical protein